MGGKGNEGVAGQVRQLSDTDRLRRTDLCRTEQNHVRIGQECLGNFVAASLDGVTEAAATAKRCPPIFEFYHERTGQDGVSDLQLHVAVFRRGQGSQERKIIAIFWTGW